MKTRRMFPLLLWLCSSLGLGLPCVNGQNIEARQKLFTALEKVRDTARPQTKNSLAKVANDYFSGRSIDDIDLNSSELEKFVAALSEEKEKLSPPNRKQLANTVTELEEAYKAYKGSNANVGNGSGNTISGNTNAGATGGGSSGSGTQSGSNEGGGKGGEETWSFGDLIMPAAIVLGSLIALALIVFSVMLLLSLQRASDALAVALPQYFNGVKARHEELVKQVAAFAAVNCEIKQRLTDLHGEVRQVSRGLQLSQQNARGSVSQAGTPATSYAPEPVVDKRDEMPSFPIAADDFLRRMQPKAMVVKRDFQNDILVSDPDGKGELVLIRDARIPDEIQPLFIVPSVTQFQMRQEYYNFYEKYYDCTNPESGAVWIIDPAVVDKVSGGWQLREKGRLEVR